MLRNPFPIISTNGGKASRPRTAQPGRNTSGRKRPEAQRRSWSRRSPSSTPARKTAEASSACEWTPCLRKDGLLF